MKLFLSQHIELHFCSGVKHQLPSCYLECCGGNGPTPTLPKLHMLQCVIALLIRELYKPFMHKYELEPPATYAMHGDDLRERVEKVSK